MIKKLRKNQRFFLIALIVICMGIILSGGLYYISSLRANLMEQLVQNVLTVTKQQQQAFDNFIAGDQERLHSFADFFVYDENSSPEEARQMLTPFYEVDAIYTVINLDEGWFCSSTSNNIRQLDKESLEVYSSLQGRGVRNSFIGQFSGNPRFGYYETFTFSNGDRGLVQKSYDRTKVSETFSLSFYNNQGLSHVVNQDGDILLRPASITEDFYDSIFDAMASDDGQQDKVELFKAALHGRETGSMTFSSGSGELVYTYVPMKNVEGWFLVSVVSANAITAETDAILMNSRLTFGALAVVLMLCAMFILLIWRNYKDIERKDRKIEYQDELCQG